jgi:hypothetical protein
VSPREPHSSLSAQPLLGHMQNYVIRLWLATLVLAPIFAAREPAVSLPAVRVYVLGILAIVLSTIRGETPKLIHAEHQCWTDAFVAWLEHNVWRLD